MTDSKIAEKRLCDVFTGREISCPGKDELVVGLLGCSPTSGVCMGSIQRGVGRFMDERFFENTVFHIEVRLPCMNQQIAISTTEWINPAMNP